MTLDGTLSFAKVIEEHLELKRRNAGLEGSMPLGSYRADDPFGNHPLFKSEEQARFEETLSGSEPLVDEDMALAWQASAPASEQTDPVLATAEPQGEDTLWGRSRDFDWGD